MARLPRNVHKPGRSASCSLPLDLDAHYLALGDSYTIGASVAPEMRWPAQLAGTGWTTTRLLEALSEDALHPPYALVSLLIGVNNEYQKLDFSVFERELPLLLSRAVDPELHVHPPRAKGHGSPGR